MKNAYYLSIFLIGAIFGQVELSTTAIDFGPVSLNYTKYDTIEVTNDANGSQIITFTGQSSPFAIVPEEYSFGAYETTEFIISFTPTTLI